MGAVEVELEKYEYKYAQGAQPTIECVWEFVTIVLARGEMPIWVFRRLE